MSAATGGALADLRRQWAENPRLRLGVLAIGVILGIWLVLVMADWHASLSREYANRTTHLYKMKALAGQEEWLQRAPLAARGRAALEAGIPTVETIGLAQAQAQGWLREATAGMGDSIQVQAGEPVEEPSRPGTWRVPVTVSGAFEPRRYLELVRRIESNPSLTVIEAAMVLNRENQTFSLTVVSYYVVNGAVDAPA